MNSTELTIGELAKLSGVSINQIRYFERKNVLKPTYITASGYRMYDDRALLRLWRILFLRSLEISVEDIGRIFSYEQPEEAIPEIRQSIHLMENRIKEMQEILKQAKTVVDDYDSVSSKLNQFNIVELEDRWMTQLRTFGYDQWITAKDYKDIILKHSVSGHPMIYNSLLTLDEDTYTLCVLTQEDESADYLPKGAYLTYTTTASHEQLEETIYTFLAYIERENLACEGKLLLTFHSTLSALNDYNEIIELQIKLKKC